MLKFELRWAATAARCILPLGAVGGLTDDKDVAGLFKADCALAPWQANLVLRLSVWLVWLAPLWMQRRLKTFGALAPADREAVMEKLLASPTHLVRLTMLYLKLMTTSLLLGDERVLARLEAYDLVPGSKPARAGSPVQLGRGAQPQPGLGQALQTQPTHAERA